MEASDVGRLTHDQVGVSGSLAVLLDDGGAGFGRYGKTLTILTCPSVEDASYENDDGYDEEDPIESWTPRFRG